MSIRHNLAPALCRTTAALGAPPAFWPEQGRTAGGHRTSPVWAC